MFPPAVRFRETVSHARPVLLAKYVTARDFLSLLGRLVSISDLVPLGCLRYSPLQLYLLANWRPSEDSIGSPVVGPISEVVDQAGQCSSGEAHPSSDSPVGSVHGCLHQWFGALCGSNSTAGLWLSAETTRHINELELLAIQKAVHHFLPLIRGKVVMFHSDNSSAVAYLRNQGVLTRCPCFAQRGTSSGVPAAQYQ